MVDVTKVNLEERSIPFTQYMRPHGRKEAVATVHPSYTDEDLKAAQAIIDAGFRFEIESLSTGIISMTISDDDGDYCHELCSNSSDVPVYVKKLINQLDLETLMALRDRAAEQEGDSDAEK